MAAEADGSRRQTIDRDHARPERGQNMKMLQRRFRPITHWKSGTPFHAALLIGVLLAAPAGAAPGDKIDVLRDLAGRVGAVVGSALTCKDIARPRVQTVVDKFTAVIREASDQRGRAYRPDANARSRRHGRPHGRGGRQDRLQTGRPPARRSRTLDRRPQPLGRDRARARQRRPGAGTDTDSRAPAPAPGPAVAAATPGPAPSPPDRAPWFAA